MSSENLALPTVVGELRRRVTTPDCTPAEVFQVVRAMQRLGIPRGDIEIHIERLRAVNDATEQSPATEDNCLLGLDMVLGEAGDLSLNWDAAEMASIYVPRAVVGSRLEGVLADALIPSDMLPPRPTSDSATPAIVALPATVAGLLSTEQWRPTPADEFRAPKAQFTTRPAALLAIADRLVYEALASKIEDSLDQFLPSNVVWPRGRAVLPDSGAFRDAPLAWELPYVVKTDVAGFYESVDHSLLSMIVAGSLHAPSSLTQALESFLGAVMARPVGLPQGPRASDVFASAYLALIDREMTSLGWHFVRFADDYFIGAESMSQGRQRLETLEGFLNDHHLRLNDTKTAIFRLETYANGRGRPPRALEELQRQLRERREDWLRQSEDPDELADALSRLGAEEQLLFDVLYHGTTTIDEAIDELGEQLDPDLADVYLTYLTGLDSALQSGAPSEGMAAEFVAARDCLAHLAAAREPRALGAAERLLPWFPGLAPVTSAFLESISASDPDDVDLLINRALRSGELSDWTAAWICRSLHRRTTSISADLLGLLTAIAGDIASTPLLRLSAVWALASQSTLSWETWSQAFAAVGPALKAELLLARDQQPERYPLEPSKGLPPSSQ